MVWKNVMFLDFITELNKLRTEYPDVASCTVEKYDWFLETINKCASILETYESIWLMPLHEKILDMTHQVIIADQVEIICKLFAENWITYSSTTLKTNE